MKRFFLLFLAAVLLISCAAADPVDLSGMSFDELVALRDQLNLAIWNSREWEAVTVPAGIWQVGRDIPAGHWDIFVESPAVYQTVSYFEILDAAGLGPDYSGYSHTQSIVSMEQAESGGLPACFDVSMQEDWFFQCSGPVVFVPYPGKTDFSFR